MATHLAVLIRSESFSELWPRLAATAEATLRTGATIEELGDLGSAVALIIAAGGAEAAALPDLERVRSAGAPRSCVVGAATEHRLVISLLRSGADDYFALPGEVGGLRSWVVAQAERLATAAKVLAMATEHRRRYDFSQMIGRSPCLLTTLERASKMIPNPSATVLIQGETGTGKDLLARAIHYNSPRGAKPFVELNCAALPENLLESELFGYEAGAFTDARAAKPGLLEMASGGTLFLDEIGDLSLQLQGKLLRALEDKRVRRLGSVKHVEVDARIIAATNVDLSLAVQEGRFRQDLYYRLNVLPLRLPPLRQREGDVLLLARHFVEHYSHAYHYPVAEFSADVERTLLMNQWPGNVRELRNAVERAVVLGDGVLSTEHLLGDGGLDTTGISGSLPFPAPMREIEEAAARKMLERFGGNKTRAAEALGISRKYLYELLGGRGTGDVNPK